MILLHVRGLVSILEWRHNGHVCVSNHQPHHCLLNRLFGCRSKKTSKLRVTGLCVWDSPGTGEFPTPMASNAENVSIWWRHHDIYSNCFTSYPGGWLCQWRLRHGFQLAGITEQIRWMWLSYMNSGNTWPVRISSAVQKPLTVQLHNSKCQPLGLCRGTPKGLMYLTDDVSKVLCNVVSHCLRLAPKIKFLGNVSRIWLSKFISPAR